MIGIVLNCYFLIVVEFFSVKYIFWMKISLVFEIINNGYLNLDYVGSFFCWVNDFDFWNNLCVDDYYFFSFMCYFFV